MNSNLVLVTYATRYGSTHEVAEGIATILREHGMEVELRPMREVEQLEQYHTVIFGAPLYIGRWPKDAHNFLTHFRDTLVKRQVVIFTLGPIGSGEEEWEGVRAQLAQEMAKYPWLKPIELEVFGGRYDPALLHFPDNLLTKFPGTPLYQLEASDTRDWIAIRKWANMLVEELQPT
jgi:menaquinone-dependent protoporphyrinogen oxidase